MSEPTDPRMNKCHIVDCQAEARIYDRDGAWCRTHSDARDNDRKANEQRLTREAGGPWPTNCPRRNEPFQRSASEDLDTWDIREQLSGGIVDRHCSYCGSLHPSDFMRYATTPGYVLNPTDKPYKVYLKSPSGQETKFYFQHLSREQQQEFVDAYNDHRLLVEDGGFYVLPFFIDPKPPESKEANSDRHN